MFPSARAALTEALSKSIIEISASSLTTISGLVALMLMQFRLGYDLGIVLAKAIVCSLLTVFLLMPGLISFFPKAIHRTAHRSLVPNIRGWGRFLMKSGYCFVWLFLLLIPAAVYCSGHVEYAFSNGGVSELVYSESRAAMHKIQSTFTPSTYVALLVPAEDFEAEKAILQLCQPLLKKEADRAQQVGNGKTVYKRRDQAKESFDRTGYDRASEKQKNHGAYDDRAESDTDKKIFGYFAAVFLIHGHTLLPSRTETVLHVRNCITVLV